MTSSSSDPKVGSHHPIDLKESIKTHEEFQYLNLISSILTHGEKRGDRTGTGTLSLFAPSAGNFRFTLGPATWSADGATSTAPFPLLTTKRVGLRMVFEELIWFVKGLTDGQVLKDKGRHNNDDGHCNYATWVREEYLTRTLYLLDKYLGVMIWEGNGSREYLDSVGLQRYRERDLGPVYGFQWRHFGKDNLEISSPTT